MGKHKLSLYVRAETWNRFSQNPVQRYLFRDSWIERTLNLWLSLTDRKHKPIDESPVFRKHLWAEAFKRQLIPVKHVKIALSQETCDRLKEVAKQQGLYSADMFDDYLDWAIPGLERLGLALFRPVESRRSLSDGQS